MKERGSNASDASRRKATADDADDADSDAPYKSDGATALREVEAREKITNDRTGARGPNNQALRHWHLPRATIDSKGARRWSFKCRFCSA